MNDLTCSVSTCTNKVQARGWCNTHYSRWYQLGDAQPTVPVRRYAEGPCSRDGCMREHYAFGLCSLHYKHKWDAEHPERAAILALRRAARRLGLDPDEIVQHFESHNGRCDVCGRLSEVAHKSHLGRLAIDHDHLSGVFRGLLCAACNRAIGFMGDDPDRLRAAACYLEGSVTNGTPLRHVADRRG